MRRFQGERQVFGAVFSYILVNKVFANHLCSSMQSVVFGVSHKNETFQKLRLYAGLNSGESKGLNRIKEDSHVRTLIPGSPSRPLSPDFPISPCRYNHIKSMGLTLRSLFTVHVFCTHCYSPEDPESQKILLVLHGPLRESIK